MLNIQHPDQQEKNTQKVHLNKVQGRADLDPKKRIRASVDTVRGKPSTIHCLTFKMFPKLSRKVHGEFRRSKFRFSCRFEGRLKQSRERGQRCQDKKLETRPKAREDF